MELRQDMIRIAALSACLAAAATGCGGPAAGEFRKYGELAVNDAHSAEAVEMTSRTDAEALQDAEPLSGLGSAEAEPDAAADADPLAVTQASRTTAVPQAEPNAPQTVVPKNVESGSAQPAVTSTDSGPSEAERRRQRIIEQALAKLPPELRARMLGNNPDLASTDIGTPEEPREIRLLIPEKNFRTEDSGQVLRVNYDDIDLLKILNMEPVPADAPDHFPNWLRELDGKPIRIRGFMYPHMLESGITRFALARDNGICCFVRKPKIYDVIPVRLRDGAETDYIDGRPFDVAGVFHIRPEADEDGLFGLYEIDDAVVINE